MTDERETRITTDDPAYVRETTTVTDTAPVTVVRGGGATPWIIAAIVAVAAILAVAFLMTNRDEPVTNADDLAAAMDAGRAAGYVEGATTAMSQVPVAPAPILVPSYDGSADRSAAEASAAAADARAAAERAADSAAAADTSVSSNTTP